MKLHIVPCSLAEANAFVEEHHRHRPAARGAKFCLGVADREMADGGMAGVLIAGRPVARALDDGWTIEVTRCCTDGTRNACSMLYRAAWRAARAIGYERLVTYTLATETGASLRAAGLTIVGEVRGRSWASAGRPRVDTEPRQDKLRWELTQ